MARKKDPAGELFPSAAPSEAELTAEFEYQEFLESLGDATVGVTIQRYPKFGNIMEWCDNGNINEATLESIREKHGPGKYRLSFRGPTGMLGTKNVCIASPYDGKERQHSNGNGNNNGNDFSEFMKQQLVMQQNLVLAMLGSMKGPDLGGMMAGLAAVMTAIKPAGSTDKAPDPIAMFQAIMSMYKGAKDNEKSPLDQLRDVASVIKEFSNDGGKGNDVDSAWSMVAEVGKEAVNKLAPVLTSMVPQPLQQNRVPVVTGVQPGNPPAQASITPTLLPTPGNAVLPGNAPADANANLQKWVEAMIVFFKRKAVRGSDPGLWIDYVFESPEDPGCQALTYAIRNGATFEDLLAFDAEIAQNPQLNIWFKTVYDGIRAELLQSGIPSAGESRNDSHPIPDGQPRQTGQPMPGNLPDGTVVPKPN